MGRAHRYVHYGGSLAPIRSAPALRRLQRFGQEGVASGQANPQGMTTEHEASRTLVKSPPELWAECSDAASLARHLSESFGEIRITRLEPETTVAWEGERASGTVRIEPSGWGTRVTLTARTQVDPASDGGTEPEDETVAAVHAQDEDVDVKEEPDAVVVEEEPEAVVEDPVAAEEPVAVRGPGAVEEREAVRERGAVGERGGVGGRVAVDERVAVEAPERVAVEERERVPDTAPVERRHGLIAKVRAFFRPAPPPPMGSVPDRKPEAEVAEVEPMAEVEEEPVAEVEPVAEAEPVAEVEAVTEPEDVPAASKETEPDETAAPDPPPVPMLDAEAILTAALDSLGQAHHRPFSRT
jgi:hypothetical protein